MRHLLRFVLCTLILAFGAGRLPAEEIKGKLKSVDRDKNTVTLAVGDAEKTFSVANDARITGQFGKKLKKAVTQDVVGGLKGLKEGSDLTLTSAGEGKVTEVKLDGLQPKVKQKKKKKNK